MEPRSPTLQVDCLPAEPQRKPGVTPSAESGQWMNESQTRGENWHRVFLALLESCGWNPCCFLTEVLFEAAKLIFFIICTFQSRHFKIWNVPIFHKAGLIADIHRREVGPWQMTLLGVHHPSPWGRHRTPSWASSKALPEALKYIRMTWPWCLLVPQDVWGQGRNSQWGSYIWPMWRSFQLKLLTFFHKQPLGVQSFLSVALKDGRLMQQTAYPARLWIPANSDPLPSLESSSCFWWGHRSRSFKKCWSLLK